MAAVGEDCEHRGEHRQTSEHAAKKRAEEASPGCEHRDEDRCHPSRRDFAARGLEWSAYVP